jgi:7-carboxy-7-deazaguanine synthase
MPIEKILEQVKSFGAKHVVFTGGEPMIARGAVELTQGFRAAGLHITVETAGTVYTPVACDLMSISPKLANSTPPGEWASRHDKLRIQIDIIQRLMKEYAYQLKFVISKPEDLAEIRAIVTQAGASAGDIILMPEGTHPDAIRQKAIWVAELCKSEGFRYGPRLHVDIWGDRRGI